MNEIDTIPKSSSPLLSKVPSGPGLEMLLAEVASDMLSASVSWWRRMLTIVPRKTSITAYSMFFALSRSILAFILASMSFSTFAATRACTSTSDSLDPVPDDHRRLQRHPIRMYRCDLADFLVVDGRTRACVYYHLLQITSFPLRVERSAGLGSKLDWKVGWEVCMAWTCFLESGRDGEIYKM
jgi:hypothetical protein